MKVSTQLLPELCIIIAQDLRYPFSVILFAYYVLHILFGNMTSSKINFRPKIVKNTV